MTAFGLSPRTRRLTFDRPLVLESGDTLPR
jgi:hypothetical protein